VAFVDAIGRVAGGGSAEITASPNRATLDQLAGLQPTLLLVDEVDPLRERARPTPPSSAAPAWR
jgi:hypothetical protein